MKIEKMSFDSEKLTTENKITPHETKKQRQLTARKRIEDYIADKQLQEHIKDLDYGF